MAKSIRFCLVFYGIEVSMASSEVSKVINEMIAYGTSVSGRAVMGAHALQVIFELGNGETRSFTLEGDVANGSGKGVSKLEITIKPEVLVQISTGEINPQEAQILGLIKVKGDIWLARLFQRATRWGMAGSAH